MFAGSRPSARSRRLPMLLGVVAIAGLLILVIAQPGRTTHGTAHADELLPNLQTWDLTDNTASTGIEFIVSEGLQQLRFDNEVVNVTGDVASHRGPLEVFPRKIESCGSGQGGRQAYQRIYYDSNNTDKFERKKDRVSRDVEVGCMLFHDAHNHWHFEHFALYELYDCAVPEGATLCTRNNNLRSGEKVTFCIADVFRRSTTSDSPTSSRYGFGCGRQAAQGLSVGWGDQYTRTTSGQELSISGLLANTYCYVSTADPNNLLIERSDSDNSQSIRLTLSDNDADGSLDTVVKGTAGC